MTTLIKNILLIDGSNQPPVRADLLIKNDKIAAIGSFPRYQADTIIDGIGAYLAPGFIDIDTHSDRYLSIFSHPQQGDFLLQGVTTIIGGQDGISLAPLLYGSLDLQRFWTDPYRINIDWHTVDELLDVLSRRPLGVNFGTFVGHSTIRHTIIGNDFRDLTQKEMDVFRFLVESSLRQGAFGISFDLGSPLAALAPYRELRSLAEATEHAKGLAVFKLRKGSDTTVYPEDIRGNFLPSVTEIINLSKETGVRAQIGNFAPLKGFEDEYDQAMILVDEQAAVADVHFHLHPFGHTVIPIVSFLPLWAQRGGFDAILQNVVSQELAEKVKADLPAFNGDDIILFDIPGFEYLIGKTLRQFAEDRGASIADALIELMRLSGLRATLLYENLSTARFAEAMVCDRSMIASSSASFYESDPRGRRSKHLFDRTFTTFIDSVIEDRTIPIETAIRKLTGLPAQRLGLKNRGLIREGYFADLTLFRDGRIEHVFVNGVQVVRDGNHIDVPAGRVLRHEVT